MLEKLVACFSRIGLLYVVISTGLVVTTLKAVAAILAVAFEVANGPPTADQYGKT
jgi:hypothetical protein